MRKKLISIAGGLVIAGTIFSTSVSAEADYEVEQGDYLSKLAERFDTSVVEIMDTNNLEDTFIYEGQLLKIDNERTIEVAQGDTLSQIANEFGVEVEEIKEWNELDSDLIRIGQELNLMLPLDILERLVESENDRLQVETTAATSNESSESNQSAESNSNQSASTESQETPATNQSSSSQGSSSGQAQSQSNSQQEGRTLTMEATAYTADCNGCSGITATGINLKDNRNMKVIAVDPNVIPLGSRVYVEGYGEAIAGDTGGAIKGNIIDIHVPTKSEALQWGRRSVQVTILD